VKLTPALMEKRLAEAPRKKVGHVTFDCPNCWREITRAVWAMAIEVDDEGELRYGCETAFAKCRCGAELLVAYQPDGQGELYWLNEEEMAG